MSTFGVNFPAADQVVWKNLRAIATDLAGRGDDDSKALASSLYSTVQDPTKKPWDADERELNRANVSTFSEAFDIPSDVLEDTEILYCNNEELWGRLRDASEELNKSEADRARQYSSTLKTFLEENPHSKWDRDNRDISVGHHRLAMLHLGRR